jgi:uncharacterized protein YecE (DUF72 family)
VAEDAKLHFGTCAWTHEDWREVFYPPHLPPGERLGYYATWFNSVEVDSTFYHIPAPHVVEHWYEVTPRDFRFVCKVPREITHERKLRDSADLVTEFLQSVEPLGEKLAFLLVQLPPWFEPRYDEFALREFITHLPKSVRWAVEFRESRWRFPRIAHLLEEHGVSWVWNDVTSLENAGLAAFEFHPITADIIPLRLMGDAATKYRADGSLHYHYRETQWERATSLENWAAKVKAERSHARDVFIFANNHFEGYAPETLQRIAGRLGQEICLPELRGLKEEPPQQPELWDR